MSIFEGAKPFQSKMEKKKKLLTQIGYLKICNLNILNKCNKMI
jgi:hypothetical protein